MKNQSLYSAQSTIFITQLWQFHHFLWRSHIIFVLLWLQEVLVTELILFIP
jgi:hypothetical protein